MTNPTDHAAALAQAEEAAEAAAAEVARLRAANAATLDDRNAHGPDSAAFSAEMGRTAEDGRRAALARYPRPKADDAKSTSTAATGCHRATATDQAEDEPSSTSWADGQAEARRRIESRRQVA